MPPDVNLNFSCDGIINVQPFEKLEISAEITNKNVLLNWYCPKLSLRIPLLATAREQGSIVTYKTVLNR